MLSSKLSRWSWKLLKGALPAKYLKNATKTWPSFTLRCAVLLVLSGHACKHWYIWNNMSVSNQCMSVQNHTLINSPLHLKWLKSALGPNAKRPSNGLRIRASRKRGWSLSFQHFSMSTVIPAVTSGSGWSENHRYIPAKVRSTWSAWVESAWLILVP